MLLSFEWKGELCIIIHCSRDPIGDRDAVEGSHGLGLLAVLTERKRSDLAVYMYLDRMATGSSVPPGFGGRTSECVSL